MAVMPKSCSGFPNQNDAPYQIAMPASPIMIVSCANEITRDLVLSGRSAPNEARDVSQPRNEKPDTCWRELHATARLPHQSSNKCHLQMRPRLMRDTDTRWQYHQELPNDRSEYAQYCFSSPPPAWHPSLLFE